MHTCGCSDVFETLANNAGLEVAQGRFAVLLQDDVVLLEDGWDRRLVAPFLIFDDLIAVSGRCAHDDVRKVKDKNGIEYTDKLIEENPALRVLSNTNAMGACSSVDKSSVLIAESRLPKNQTYPRDMLYIRDVAIRTPLALDRKRAQSLGFFDPAFAPMEYDDHDLCFKAYAQHGWLCGVALIDYYSPEDWSHKRNPKRRKDGATKPERYGDNGYLPRNGRHVIYRYPELVKGLPHHAEARQVTKTLCSSSVRLIWSDDSQCVREG
mmetsp:Transcript_1158/g.4072  ORF Transcript_1158/g.4072 Transcript_1158/m.4072 type:complete len:266 (-) Transcript_1158:3537-4334(-)